MSRGRRGRDRMVVGFTIAYAWVRILLIVRCTHIQNYVRKFVSDLQQVCGFLQVLRFPPPIKLTATI